MGLKHLRSALMCAAVGLSHHGIDHDVTTKVKVMSADGAW